MRRRTARLAAYLPGRHVALLAALIGLASLGGCKSKQQQAKDATPVIEAFERLSADATARVPVAQLRRDIDSAEAQLQTWPASAADELKARALFTDALTHYRAGTDASESVKEYRALGAQTKPADLAPLRAKAIASAQTVETNFLAALEKTRLAKQVFAPR